jgi:DnaK suppressor protein
MAGKVPQKTIAKTKIPIKSGTKPAAGVAAGRTSQPVVKSKASSKAAPAAKAKDSTDITANFIKQSVAPVKLSENKRQKELDEKVRKLLIRKKEELLRETKSEIRKYVTGEKRQLVETALDEGDISVVDLAEDISLKQLSAHREILQKIDTACRKLDEGTYGVCDECGDEIGVERLMIMPFAILCRDCQEERELRDKIERENPTS